LGPDGSETDTTQRHAAVRVQVAPNATWSPVFFGNKAVAKALAIIVVMVLDTIGTIALHKWHRHPHRRTHAMCLCRQGRVKTP